MFSIPSIEGAEGLIPGTGLITNLRSQAWSDSARPADPRCCAAHVTQPQLIHQGGAECFRVS
jgi:hypothetical protein